MIILLVHERVVVTPAKTGSTSLHRSLTNLSGGRWMMDTEMGKHANWVPVGFQHFEISILVRNPYTRFQSLWGHRQKDCLEAGKDPGTIEEFAHEVVNDPIWFNGSISDIYKDCGWQRYWQIEHIKQCLDRVNIHEWVPHINRTVFAKQALPQEIIDIIRPWAEPDCEAFNYELR